MLWLIVLITALFVCEGALALPIDDTLRHVAKRQPTLDLEAAAVRIHNKRSALDIFRGSVAVPQAVKDEAKNMMRNRATKTYQLIRGPGRSTQVRDLGLGGREVVHTQKDAHGGGWTVVHFTSYGKKSDSIEVSRFKADGTPRSKGSERILDPDRKDDRRAFYRLSRLPRDQGEVKGKEPKAKLKKVAKAMRLLAKSEASSAELAAVTAGGSAISFR